MDGPASASRVSRTRALLLATSLLLATACSGEPGALFIDLRTDLVPGAEFAAARVVVDALGREVVHGVVPDGDYANGVRIAELADVPHGELHVEVELVFGGEVVTARGVTVDVDGPEGVTVVVARTCRDVTCSDPDAPACLGNVCVPTDCTPENPAACPADPECASDADCATASPCATARCESGACFAVSDDAACGAGERCNPEGDCEPLPLAFGMVRDLRSELSLTERSLDDPVSTPDGLELYVNARNPNTGIVVSVRTRTSDPWPPATPVAELNTTAFRPSDPVLSSDGLEIWLGAFDADFDRYTSTRPDRTSPFSDPVPFLPGMGSRGTLPMWISADDLRMLLRQSLQMTERADRASPWGPLMVVPEIEELRYEILDIQPFAGETRAIVAIGEALHEMSRAAPGEPWGLPWPVPGLPPDPLSDPAISEDGTTLYFTRHEEDSSTSTVMVAFR